MFVAKLNDDERLCALVNRLDESDSRAKESLKFLKKQTEDLENRVNAEQKGIWEDIQSVLKQMDVLPKDYKEDEYVIKYNKPKKEFTCYPIEEYKKKFK